MRNMSCQGVRRRLSAFHDGELPTAEQVAVEVHLRGCGRCADEVAAFAEIGAHLRGRAALLAAAHETDFEALRSDILSRVAAEREESVAVWFPRMFEDMRLGFAALGSTAASLVLVLLVVGIFYFGPQSERPDSLAGVMQTMGASGGVDVRDLVGQKIGEPSARDREAMSASTMRPPVPPSPFSAAEALTPDEDAVFALAAVITRQGRVASLEVVRSDNGADSEAVLRLLDQVSRARLEPARVGGAPVATRRVWVMAHTTVRAKLPRQSAWPSVWMDASASI